MKTDCPGQPTSAQECRYDLIGGPLNGREVVRTGPIAPGTEIELPAPEELKTAIYLFGEEGAFRFARYAPSESTPVSPEQLAAAEKVIGELRALLKKLAACYGSTDNLPLRIELDDWVLERENE